MEKEEARKAKETKQEKKTMTGKKYIAAALFASVLTVLTPASGIFEIFENGAPLGCTTVSAAEKENGGQTGEITVYMHGSTEYVKDIPLSGEEVAVYRAAYLKDGIWTPTELFADSGFRLEDMTAESMERCADLLYQYVNDNAIKGSAAVTDENGRAVFSGLEAGLYLVCPEKETSYETEKEAGVFLADPYVVSVPSEINGQADYTVETVPKTEWVPEEEGDGQGNTPGDNGNGGDGGGFHDGGSGDETRPADETDKTDEGWLGVQTGDTTRVSGYILVLLASGVVIADMIADRRRNAR